MQFDPLRLPAHARALCDALRHRAPAGDTPPGPWATLPESRRRTLVAQLDAVLDDDAALQAEGAAELTAA